MTIQECYEALGGNYEDVLGRLMNQKLVEKYIGKFLDDDSFDNLWRAVEAGETEEAFRAAHTLKGVCMNLGLDTLAGTVSELTELLRGRTGEMPDGTENLLKSVKCDYEAATGIIRMYLEG